MTQEDEKLLSEKIVIEIQHYLSKDDLTDLQKILIIHLTVINYVNTLHYEKYIQFSKASQTEEK